MIVGNGHCDVNARKQREHECLEEAHKETKGHKDHRDKQRGHVGKDTEDLVIACHVSSEAQAQGDRANDMADEFNHKHQGDQKKNRPHKMFEVGSTRLFESLVVVVQKHHQTDSEVGVHVVGGREKAGDQAHEVADQDVQEDACKQPKVLFRVVAKDVLEHLIEAFKADLNDVAKR